jgi:glutamate--cysteine ligase
VAAVQAAEASLRHPDTLPSARVLRAIMDQHDGSFVAFARAQSLATRQAMLEAPMTDPMQQEFAHMAQESLEAQRRIEASDTMPFDVYLQEYLSPKRLKPAKSL